MRAKICKQKSKKKNEFQNCRWSDIPIIVQQIPEKKYKITINSRKNKLN